MLSTKFGFAAALIGLAAAAHAEAQQDGPFGLIIGNSIPGDECEKVKGSFYRCDPPRKHPDFESYVVQATGEQGICWVKGIGLDISTNGYGTGVKSRADEIAEQIQTIYGAPTEKMDRLVYGSIWDEPNDWMMGLAQDDRFYAHIWEDVQIRRVDEIYVSANASSSNTGYVTVEFYGDNYDACQASSAKDESKAF